MIGVIAPDSADRTEIATQLTERGYRVSVSDAAGASITRLSEAGAEVLIVDLVASDALRFLRRHAAHWRRLPVVCLADRRKPNSSSEALRLGAADIVARPLRIDDLQATLTNVAQVAATPSDEAPEPQAPIEAAPDGVFGISPAMQSVLALVRRVALSTCGVLIVGERGTGREMVARAIHARGSRRDGEFVKIACGAAEPADFAPLFTPADGSRTTVYLEDLPELGDELQVRLDAWLRTHLKAGDAPVEESLRPRVIAGAQPRVFDVMERGLVSRDLVEAISVVRIDLEPLRRRSQDIPLFAVHFLKDACRQANIPTKTLSRGAMQLLRALPWRGNIAELQSLCERLTVLVPRGVVLLEDVLAHVHLDGGEAVGRLRSDETLRQARQRFERDYVAAVVEQNRGRIGAAARQLGIERTNLYRKLKQLNIPGTGGFHD